MEDFRTRARRSLAKGGAPLLLKKFAVRGLEAVRDKLLDAYYWLVPAQKFTFRGKDYRYLRHTYNNATHNERTVEVPVVRREVEKALSGGRRVLEVGNVLANYADIRHDVLDKYEPGRGIINEDALDWKPAKPYDLIVSISTMEHIGWDEEPRTPEKILLAFRNLLDNCLSPGGKLLATMPMGYNSFLDECVYDGRLPVPEQYFLKRISEDNRWREAAKEEVRGSRYGSPFPNANAVIFAVYKKP